jgi:hypothetical protein
MWLAFFENGLSAGVRTRLGAEQISCESWKALRRAEKS